MVKRVGCEHVYPVKSGMSPRHQTGLFYTRQFHFCRKVSGRRNSPKSIKCGSRCFLTASNFYSNNFSGAVRIERNGKEIARFDEIGSTFGELAAIDGKARSASVEAIGPTVCLAIDTSFMNETAEPLEQVLFVSVLYKLFAEVIAQRLRYANDELARVRLELETLKGDRV